MQKTLLRLFIWGLVLLPSSAYSLTFSREYDGQFNSSAKAWLPGVDWKILKAQCYQESRLRPDAVSPVGAQGLCQFMPGTWRGVEKKLKFPPEASAFAPELSIEAAAFYMGSLRRSWSSLRPDEDRHKLAAASYNAGLGHLLKAQKLCGGGNLYSDIITCLPDVTGIHSKETIGYVKAIYKFWTIMVLGGG